MRSDVVATLKARKRAAWRDVDILCDNVQCIPFGDVLELYLALSGVRHWRWVDVRQRHRDRQSLPAMVGHLVRDMALWPWLYARQVRQVAALAAQPVRRMKLSSGASLLFLRTDHWFGLQSGGSVGHLRGVIDSLRVLGYRPQVVSTDFLAGISTDIDFHLCEPVYRVGRNVPGLNEMFYNQQVAKFTRAHWPDWSPAFIYQRYSLGNYAGVLLRAHYGVPLICEYNGSLVWMMRHWTRKKLCYEKLNTQIELLNLHAADVVVVNSQPMADELGVRGLRDLDKVLVNPNGVDPDRYSPTVDGSAVRQRYGLQDVLLIGFIGSFGPWHGVDVLIQAFGQLMRTNPGDRAKVRLMLIGDGPEMPSVRARIAELGIGGECILIGAVPQEKGPAYLAACDILASPHVPNLDGSRFFGSPTKLFEYMAMGKGIVASDLEQIGEILKHDQTAWLVRPGDVGDLMAGLKRLLDDNACRHRLGAAARREVTARYTWQEHTRRIMSKLDERAR